MRKELMHNNFQIIVTVHGHVEGQNYRGFDIAQRVGIPCGAGFQLAQSPLRERLL